LQRVCFDIKRAHEEKISHLQNLRFLDKSSNRNLNFLISFGVEKCLKIWNIRLRIDLESIKVSQLTQKIPGFKSKSNDKIYKLGERSIKLKDTNFGCQNRVIEKGLIFFVSEIDKQTNQETQRFYFNLHLNSENSTETIWNYDYLMNTTQLEEICRS